MPAVATKAYFDEGAGKWKNAQNPKHNSLKLRYFYKYNIQSVISGSGEYYSRTFTSEGISDTWNDPVIAYLLISIYYSKNLLKITYNSKEKLLICNR